MIRRLDDPWVDKFMRRVRVSPSGCWDWLGYLGPTGYPTAIQTRDGGKAIAHRAAYIEFVGPIPPGLQLDHLCRNRACVNPGHLEPVTHRENSQRATKYRARKAFCLNGHVRSPENLTTSGNCRECKKAGRRELYQRQMADPVRREARAAWTRAYQARKKAEAS